MIGVAYFNIHTTAHPGGGGIRGQLVVPGPIAGAGLPGLILVSGGLSAGGDGGRKPPGLQQRALVRRDRRSSQNGRPARNFRLHQASETHGRSLLLGWDRPAQFGQSPPD